MGGWGQRALRRLGWGPQRGLRWAWGRGGWGASRWCSTQLILDDKDARQSRGTLRWGAGVQAGLGGWAGQALGLGRRARVGSGGWAGRGPGWVWGGHVGTVSQGGLVR